MREQKNRKSRKSRFYDYLVFWAITLAYLFIFALIISTYSPFKLIKTKYASRYLFTIMYQMRWNVYVRPPWEPSYKLYTIHSGRPVYEDLRPFQSKYLFGLRREYKLVFAEINLVYLDTPALTRMNKYKVTLPKNADLADYINADTLKTNNYKNDNILYLKGRYLLAIGPTMDWERDRKKLDTVVTLTVVPLNIEPPQ